MPKLKSATFRAHDLTGHRPPRAEEEGRPRARPTVNEAESPLAWLRARRGKSGEALISESQFAAGERLRRDFERAQLQGRVTTNWDPSAAARRGASNAPAELADSALAARERYHRALAAVGPELSAILVPVCCLSSGLEQAERLLQLPQRSGKAVLGLALNALVRHYGLDRVRHPDRAAPRHWGLAGYRPRVPPPDEA
jgi:hypothetical protein